MTFSNGDDTEDENQGSSSENEEEEGLDQLSDGSVNDDSLSDQDKSSSASDSERSSSGSTWDLEPELQAIKGAYVISWPRDDTEKSSADRVEAEAREKTSMPKLKIRIAPLGIKRKLNEPTDEEIDKARAQSPSLIPSRKKKPKTQLTEKPTKKSRKGTKPIATRRKGKENTLHMGQ